MPLNHFTVKYQISVNMDIYHLRVLSIDPGSENLGYTFSQVSLINKEFVVVESDTISVDKVCGLQADFDMPTLQLLYQHLPKVIIDLLEHYSPDVVICEAPYMGRFPHAYAILVMCTQVIQNTVQDYDFTMQFTLVEPSTVKKRVGVKGNDGRKESVKEALPLIKTITLPKNYDTLDEHAIDSIAIGYSEFFDIIGK